MNEFKQVFSLTDGGNRPVRYSGGRWIADKRKALQRILDRYGAYITHLTTLVEDKSLTGTDRQRPRLMLQWTETKIILCCVYYVDILQALACLSLSLQEDTVDIVMAIKQILIAHQSLIILGCLQMIHMNGL